MKVLLCMIYLHLIDDYVLQGILAQLKQRAFLKPYGNKYQADYVDTSLKHGFMNAFLVHIPIYIWLCKNEPIIFVSVLFLGTIHTMIDDWKANAKKTNLFQGQFLHIVFIYILWISFDLFGGKI